MVVKEYLQYLTVRRKLGPSYFRFWCAK